MGMRLCGDSEHRVRAVASDCPGTLLLRTRRENMADIRDYLAWRGDLSFSEKDLGPADNLVFCFFNYIDLTPLGNPNGMTVRQCIRALQEKNAVRFQITDVGSPADPFLDRIADSTRFGDILVEDYVDIHDAGSSLQFSAATYLLPDGRRFIAFRGTDESWEGWKEDFDISYHVTHAQKMAADYLKREMESPGFVFAAGHSKGGNLALYAVSKLAPAELDRVLFLYNNDGPGLSPDVTDFSALDHMKGRMLLIQPEFSIFGNLFPLPQCPHQIVKSSKDGILEHDLSSWQIDGDQIVTADSFDPLSLLVNQTMDKWVGSKDLYTRRDFVNSVFDALADEGIRELEDIRKKPQKVLSILSRLTGEKMTMKVAIDLPRKFLFSDTIDSLKTDGFLTLVQNHPLIRNLLLALLGAFIFALNENILNVLALLLPAVLFGLELVTTISALAAGGWKIEAEKGRLWVLVITFGFLASVIMKADARTFLGSELMGIALLLTSHGKLGEISESRRGRKMFRIFEFFCWGMSGLTFLLAPSRILYTSAHYIGIYMVFDGLVNAFIYRPRKVVRLAPRV